jgi:hypothetical protein
MQKFIISVKDKNTGRDVVDSIKEENDFINLNTQGDEK